MDSTLFSPYQHPEDEDEPSVGGVPGQGLPPQDAMLFSSLLSAESSLGLFWGDVPPGPSNLPAPEPIIMHPHAPHLPPAPLLDAPEPVPRTPPWTREYFHPLDSPVVMPPLPPPNNKRAIQPIHTRSASTSPSLAPRAYMVFSSASRTGYGKYTKMEDDEDILYGVESVVFPSEVAPTPEEESHDDPPPSPQAQEEQVSVRKRFKRRWSRAKRNPEAGTVETRETGRRSSVFDAIARLWSKSIPNPARRSRRTSQTNGVPVTVERNGASVPDDRIHTAPSLPPPLEPPHQDGPPLSTRTFPIPRDWSQFGRFARPCIGNVWLDNIYPYPNSNPNRKPDEILSSLQVNGEDPNRVIYHPENWVVGTPHKEIPDRPTFWPAPTPDRPLVIHPASTYTVNPNFLTHWPYGISQLCWDVSTSPRFTKMNEENESSIQDSMCIASEFGEPATFPLAPSMRIVRWADDSVHWWPWPWPIEVCNPEGVLVGDVLQAVYSNLGELLNEEEWAGLGERRREAVTRVWKGRIQGRLKEAMARRDAGQDWEGSGADGVRRFDLLLENRYFRGLDVAPGGEGWLVHFGPPP